MDPLKISFPWRTATGKIALQPVLLFSVTAVSDDVGTGEITLRNGSSTSGEIKLVMSVYKGITRQLSWSPPLFFDKGLHLEKGANVTGVLFQYQEFRE